LSRAEAIRLAIKLIDDYHLKVKAEIPDDDIRSDYQVIQEFKEIEE